MPARIAYIELDTHAEIANRFHDLMLQSEAFSVDYYFSKRILEILEVDGDNIFLSSNSDILKQLNQRHYDLVVIGTVHRYFDLFFRITKRYHTAVICHNLNFIKASKLDLLNGILEKETRYRLKLLLKEKLFLKDKVYKQAQSLWVLSQELAQEKYEYLPLFYNEFDSAAENEIPTIVIPGSVSQLRRDYERVINRLYNATLPLKVIFLGKASGQELEKIKKLKSEKTVLDIVYFTEMVPQPVFDDWMKKADILWCPIQDETKFLGIKENYGITKTSGNIGDAIRYGKRAIFPKFYQNKYPFILLEEDYFSGKKPVFNFAFEDFTKDKIRKDLEKKLLKACK